MSKKESGYLHLFDFEFLGGTSISLTSCSENLRVNERQYCCKSGLSIAKANFNDSGKNLIIIKGIYEKEGIEKECCIDGAIVSISSFDENAVKQSYRYICTKVVSNDLEFELYCEPETIKYQKQLLNSFSKTCRANFADDKCGISLPKYSIDSIPYEISGKFMKFKELEGAKFSYFQNGTLQVLKQHLKIAEYKICIHAKETIGLEQEFTLSANEYTSIKLIPSCDKKYLTCCYSYDNAVNFRGEPFVPDRFIEN